MNPFLFGKVVTGGDFCPRPGLVRELSGSLRAGQSTVVLGERRTGKTSLIFEAVRMRRGTRLLYAQFWAVKTVEEIVRRLLHGMASMEARGSFWTKLGRSLAHLRPRIEFDPMTGQPSVTLGVGQALRPGSLHAVFDLIEEIGAGKLVVALDEFQDIRDVPDFGAVLGEMRGRIQREKGIPYIFAGSIRHEMERIFRDPSSPFFKSVRVIEVGSLPDDSFREFLEKRFRAGGRRVEVSAYARIFELAEENPGDIQQLCAAVWDTTAAGDAVGPGKIDAALLRILASERKGYESLVRPLTDIQQRCLRALARIGGARPQAKAFLEESGIRLPASARRALGRLIDLQIVYGSEKAHKFFDPFFRQWVLREL